MINKCSFCKKKLKIISYTCDCNGVFCEKHRLRHVHKCIVIKNKDILKTQNPQIIPQKVIKI
jgi:predicted nucleic acid binding AN1-type Zn finger protein